MIIRGASLISRAAAFLTILFAVTACGGGGGNSAAFVPNTLELRVTVEKESVPVNMAEAQAQPGSPFVSQITVRVTENSSGVPVQGSSVTLSFSGAQIGGFLSEAGLFSGEGLPRPSVTVTAGANGEAIVYFVAGALSGEANIRVVAQAAGGRNKETSTIISVISTAGPVAALEFTGPFIEAIQANRVEFGLAPGETADFQNGTYSRVVSVTANDANGNPVAMNTPIVFRLIDAPLVGYPELGSGSFIMTGSSGNPVEGNFGFEAIGGNFLAQGARLADRLVLDPDPDGRSFYHAGIRTISELPASQPDSLSIRADREPFGVGEDQGHSVPYIVGRARAGSIQSLAFTDADGTASTLLSYPFSNLGRTAILVAQTEDFSVSRVFNPGGSVYLGSLEEVGLTLTASTTILPSNVDNGTVTLCVVDGNRVPLPGFPVGFNTKDAQGASVDVNGQGESGTLLTGEGGCVTAVVNVENQFPGSGPIVLAFFISASGGEETEQVQTEVTILAPESGNLIGSANCSARTLGLLYLTSSGDPIADALISVSSSTWPLGSPNFIFSPPSAGGPDAGITSDNGEVTVDFTVVLPPAGEADQTLTYSATFATGNGDSQFSLQCSYTVEGTGPPTPTPLTITTSSLPDADDGVAYNALLQSVGGAATNSWTLVDDGGAAGLSIMDVGATTAELSWAAPVAGSYDIVVRVVDADGEVAQRTLTLLVNP